MALTIYNVLTRKKELFVPQEANKVKMYACGITVSGDAHIGHAYQAIIFDTIKKYLENQGYLVTYVRNYTDVDDKIIIKARSLGASPITYANEMIIKTDKELDALSVDRATVQARATDCIDDIIKFIEKLIAKGHAYATSEGNVYFKVNSFKNYGKFSNRVIEDSMIGVRKDLEPDKLEDADFALWKNAKDDEIFWTSPWGNGRPGWHIECSTMSMKYLGETIDIHGGGKDLLFPHHENEIAQSESLTDKQLSKFWIHNGLIKVNGQKMSKSLNNGILLEDLLKKYHPDTIRMTLLQNNYRSDLNIIDGMFEENERKIYSFYKLFDQIDALSLDNNISDYASSIKTSFEEAMNNDFNTSVAIANLFGYMSEIAKRLEKKDVSELLSIKNEIIKIYNILGILQHNPKQVINEMRAKIILKSGITESDINDLILKRNEYKIAKDFTNADNIRNDLKAKGILLEDSKDGTNWEIDFK